MIDTTYLPPIARLAGTPWGDELDFTDPLIAEPNDLLHLYATAPDLEAKAFIVGIMDTRETIGSVTGIRFDLPVEGNVIDHPLNRADPEWVAELDRVDVLLCVSGELEHLINVAPSDELKSFITGIMDVRHMIKLVTGAEF